MGRVHRLDGHCGQGGLCSRLQGHPCQHSPSRQGWHCIGWSNIATGGPQQLLRDRELGSWAGEFLGVTCWTVGC